MSCWKRSQVCGEPKPCRESQAHPGVCLWCLCPLAGGPPIAVPGSRWDQCDGDPALCDCSEHDNARRAAASHEPRQRIVGATRAELEALERKYPVSTAAGLLDLWLMRRRNVELTYWFDGSGFRCRIVAHPAGIEVTEHGPSRELAQARAIEAFDRAVEAL